MERILGKLFDYQRFERNSRLAKIITEAETYRAEELADDALFSVAAAGEADKAKKTEQDMFSPADVLLADISEDGFTGPHIADP